MDADDPVTCDVEGGGRVSQLIAEQEEFPRTTRLPLPSPLDAFMQPRVRDINFPSSQAT